MNQAKRIGVFLVALVISAVVGSIVNAVLTNGGWDTKFASLGGVIGFFVALLIFYRLISVRVH